MYTALSNFFKKIPPIYLKYSLPLFAAFILTFLIIIVKNFKPVIMAEAKNKKEAFMKINRKLTPTPSPTPELINTVFAQAPLTLITPTTETQSLPTPLPTQPSVSSPAPVSATSQTPTQPSTPTPSAPQTPTQESPAPVTDFKFSVVVNDYANRSSELSSLEQQLGKKISGVSIFKQFGLAFNNMLVLEDLAYARSNGMKVNIAWEPWNPEQGMNQATDYLKEIPQGTHNSYLKSFANAIKNYQSPVTIRFGHEMNGNWYPWGNRPGEYIAAYRYIVNLFRGEGISNVSWMWAINADNIPWTPIQNAAVYYPGDDVVDVVGIDGYNFGTPSWKSFKDIFLPAYNFLTGTYQKPIVIAETAASESGGNKALWVTNMFKYELPNNFPKVKELVWFNLLKERDWRINSSAESLEAFKNNLY